MSIESINKLKYEVLNALKNARTTPQTINLYHLETNRLFNIVTQKVLIGGVDTGLIMFEDGLYRINDLTIIFIGEVSSMEIELV